MILFLKAFPDRVSKEFKKKKIQSTVPSEWLSFWDSKPVW
jgi:hypothetical protein